MKMSKIKLLILEWCLQSWKSLKESRKVIAGGWKRCCLQFCDALDPAVRREVTNSAHRGEFDGHFIPEGEEPDGHGEGADTDSGSESDHEEDEEKNMIWISARRSQSDNEEARASASSSKCMDML
jgi:hypothetical protein